MEKRSLSTRVRNDPKTSMATVKLLATSIYGKPARLGISSGLAYLFITYTA